MILLQLVIEFSDAMRQKINIIESVPTLSGFNFTFHLCIMLATAYSFTL